VSYNLIMFLVSFQGLGARPHVFSLLLYVAYVVKEVFKLLRVPVPVHMTLVESHVHSLDLPETKVDVGLTWHLVFWTPLVDRVFTARDIYMTS